MTNVVCDIIKASNTSTSNNSSNRAFGLFVPPSLRLIPLYMLSMIKSVRDDLRENDCMNFRLFRRHFDQEV
jgi:hypothetical protein